jgi:hypothetical protein
MSHTFLPSPRTTTRYSICPAQATPLVATRSAGLTLQGPLTENRQGRSDRGRTRPTGTPTNATTTTPSTTTTTTTMSIAANVPTGNPPLPPLPPPPPQPKDGISDNFTPDVYHGRTNENPIEWLTYFERYNEYKKIKEAEKISFFKLLLRGMNVCIFIFIHSPTHPLTHSMSYTDISELYTVAVHTYL